MREFREIKAEEGSSIRIIGEVKGSATFKAFVRGHGLHIEAYKFPIEKVYVARADRFPLVEEIRTIKAMFWEKDEHTVFEDAEDNTIVIWKI